MGRALIFVGLFAVNIAFMFVNMGVYNWWNPMAAGFIAALFMVDVVERRF